MKNIKLLKFRNKLGFSQAKVAKAIGVSKQYYNFIENGERRGSVEVLKKLAKLYNTTIDDLLEQDVEEDLFKLPSKNSSSKK